MPPASAKKSMFMITGAFVVLIGLLLFVLPPVKMPFFPISAFVAGAAALVCIWWSLTKLLPRGELPTISRFQTNYIASLALAELVFLLGFTMGTGPGGLVPFALTAWALILLVALPKLIAFWNRYERG